MENASKALLIAGAILIVILLIAVGMMVYNSASGTIDKAIGQMSTTEKSMHNSQFEQYLGNSVKGSNVKNLINKVMANNGNVDNVQVTLEPTGIVVNNIQTGSTDKYKVEAKYTEGVISIITITEVTP